MSKAENPTVLIDMDGVIADFDNGVLRRIADRHPDIEIVPRANFYISEDYPTHTVLVRAMSDEEGFFDSLPLVDGALDGWQRIIDLGYWPRVCSSPIDTNPTSKKEKLNWLQTHFAPMFGSFVVKQAIITKHKYSCDGIALIDDRPELKDAQKAKWQHIVFDRPYNQHSKEPRLFGWQDENLPDLLEKANRRHR